MPEPRPTFPDSLPASDLLRAHDEFQAASIEKYLDLYEGGARFRKNIERYLDKRQIEKGADAPLTLDREDVYAGQKAQGGAYGLGAAMWEARKVVSRYTNYVAGQIDQIVSSIFTSEPYFDGPSPYWTDLNRNADGYGADLAALARAMVLDAMVCGRPWLYLTGPQVHAANLADAEKQGVLSLRLTLLKTSCINDWVMQDGAYTMVRVYGCEDVRSNPWAAPDKVRHTWTFILPDRVVKYVAEVQKGEALKAGTQVARKSEDLHGINGLPAIPASPHVWAMQRLEDPTLKLYNRESALTWSLNQHAYPFLTVNRTNKAASILISDTSAVDLDEGESIQYVSPDPGSFESQFKDRDQCKKDMHEVFQAMALNALASQTQNARQAAEAKRIDKEPLSALLRMFHYVAYDALEQAGRKIAVYRGEDPSTVKLVWPDAFNDKAVSEKLAELLQSSAIPNFPPTALREQLKAVAVQSAQGADAETIKKISNEADAAAFTPKPVEPAKVESKEAA